MSEEAFREQERGYDYETERLAVLRQDAYDPHDDLGYCGTHDEYYELEVGCEKFHEPVPAPAPILFDPADEPPF